MRRFNGYTEAQKIDKVLSKTLAEHPVNKSNWVEWEKLLRTIATSLQLITAKTKRFRDEV